MLLLNGEPAKAEGPYRLEDALGWEPADSAFDLSVLPQFHPRIYVDFNNACCWGCPAKTDCTSARFRSLTLHPRGQRSSAAPSGEQDPDAEMYECEAKTEARDAFVIADVARTNPRALRQITVADETEAELAMLVGFDDDLAGESTRTSNRLRGLLAQIHPSLERVLGPRIHHPAVLELLSAFGSPQQQRKAGIRQIAKVLKPKAPRMAERLAAEINEALAEQTVVVPGTNAAEVIVPSLARQLSEILTQRHTLEGQLAALLEAHPLSRLLTSMPGVGVRIAATLLVTIGERPRVPGRRPSRVLRRLVPGHEVVRLVHQGRTRATARKQTAQTRYVPVRIRHTSRSGLPRLLRPAPRHRQNPHPGAATPGPAPHHRPARHAPRRLLLRIPPRNRLTKDIGAPPPALPDTMRTRRGPTSQ